MNVTVRITGDTATIANLKQLENGLTDFSSVMRKIGTELKTFYSGQVFASEGGAIGQRWAALSPVYRRNKGSKYPGKSILVASGKLRSSFRATTSQKSVIIDNTRTVNGYNLASIHQNGLGYQSKRPILVVTKDVSDIVEHVINLDIKEKVDKANA